MAADSPTAAALRNGCYGRLTSVGNRGEIVRHTQNDDDCASSTSANMLARVDPAAKSALPVLTNCGAYL